MQRCRLRLFAVLFWASASATAAPAPALKVCGPAPFHRDWLKHPALIELDDFTGSLFVLGDVHGAYDDVVLLLAKAGLAKVTGSEDAPVVEWTGDAAVLVQVGDLIDKGPKSLPTINLFRSLETAAAASGGRVIVLAGNHELAFLDDPLGKKARVLHQELEFNLNKICSEVYSPSSAPGAWLRQRPAAAIVDGIYLSHSGWTMGLSRKQIANKYQHVVDRGTWDSKFSCGSGRGKKAKSGFFNAKRWWTTAPALDELLRNIGARQIVFGHDPGAFDAVGEIFAYMDADSGRALIKVDVELWKRMGPPALLKCATWRGKGGGCANFERLMVLSADQAAKLELLPVATRIPTNFTESQPKVGC